MKYSIIMKKRVQGFDRANLLETWSRKSESTTRLRQGAFQFPWQSKDKTQPRTCHLLQLIFILCSAAHNNYFFYSKHLLVLYQSTDSESDVKLHSHYTMMETHYQTAQLNLQQLVALAGDVFEARTTTGSELFSNII